MTDFTPGPWIYASTGPTMQAYEQPFAITQSGERNLICGCFGDVQGGFPTALANARRIVQCVNAHDDLVAAIAGLLCIQDQMAPFGGGCLPADYGIAREAARVALAKARGEDAP